MKDYLTFFRESYGRVCKTEAQRDEFLDAFYEAFVEESEEIAAKFAQTDMRRQKKMLHQSLRHMVNFSVERQASDALRKIAGRHSKSQIDIDPGMYDIWLDSLIEAVQLFDARFTDEVELAWRVVLAPGIVYMKFRHDKPTFSGDFHFVEAEPVSEPE